MEEKKLFVKNTHSLIDEWREIELVKLLKDKKLCYILYKDDNCYDIVRYNSVYIKEYSKMEKEWKYRKGSMKSLSYLIENRKK